MPCVMHLDYFIDWIVIRMLTWFIFKNANSQSITSDYWNKCYASVNRANNAIHAITQNAGRSCD